MTALFPDYAVLSKWVPTDMDWHGNYAGGYACVYLCGGVMPLKRDPSIVPWHVVVHGTDDTMVGHWYDTLEEALEQFNRITYLQSHADLRWIEQDDCNGYPTERMQIPTAVWPVFVDVDAEWNRHVDGAYHHPPTQPWSGR